MCEAVLVHAEVDEGSERGDIGDEAGELHSWLEILDFHRLVGEGKNLKLLARVAAGLGEFFEDVLQGRETDLRCDVFFQFDGSAPSGVLHQLGDRAADIRRHAVDEGVALGVHGTGVERMPPVADAEEASSLFEGLGAETWNLQEILTGLEGAILVAELHEIHRRAGIQSGDIPEQVRAGGVEFHTHMVHAGNDGVIE